MELNTEAKETVLREINAKLHNNADRAFACQILMDFIAQIKTENPLDTLLDTLAMVALNKDDLSRIVTAEAILKYALELKIFNEEKYFDLLGSMSYWGGVLGFSMKRRSLLNELNRSYKKDVDIS